MKVFSTILSELRVSFSRRGFLGTIKLIYKNLFHIIKFYFFHKNETDEFDEKYGLDTVNIVKISDLDVNSENLVFASRYQAINNNKFLSVINSLHINHKDFIFIDLGAGKGRALLLASLFSFDKIIGVEFSQKLVEISRENIKKYSLKTELKSDIKLYLQDATKFEFPLSQLIVFMYNPFKEQVMDIVINNIYNSFEKKPRKIFVVYISSVSRDIFEEYSFMAKKKFDSACLIYESLS